MGFIIALLAINPIFAALGIKVEKPLDVVWLIVGLILITVFVVFVLRGIGNLLVWITPGTEINEAKVSVKILKPVISARPPEIQTKRIDKDKDRLVAAIEVLNITPGTTAEKVLPTITWFTKRGRVETENHGRWWLSSEDQKRLKDYEKLAIDLLSNGTRYLFHFARTSQDANFFYAYFREKNGKDGYSKLYDNVYRVKVHLQSNNNAMADFFYVVKHENGVLFFEEVSK